MAEVLFNALLVVYAVTTLVSAVTCFSKTGVARWLTRGAFFVALLLHTAVIAQRWWAAGRPPFSNMFETLVFFGWSVVLVYLFMEIKYGIRVLAPGISAFALLSLAYATLIFPKTIEPLMPALQNNFWLTIHVFFCFIGYAAFTISYIAALVILLRRTDWHRYAAGYVLSLSAVIVATGLLSVYLVRAGIMTLEFNLVTALLFFLGTLVSGAVLTPPVLWISHQMRRLPAMEADLLEMLLHRTVILGFVFLAIGIVTGSIWAHQAWGRYWGWDPKETWSLLTWLIYGIYLHVRFMWGRKDVGSFWLAVLGFWAVIFTYFGVNFVLAGLHSYA